MADKSINADGFFRSGTVTINASTGSRLYLELNQLYAYEGGSALSMFGFVGAKTKKNISFEKCPYMPNGRPYCGSLQDNAHASFQDTLSNIHQALQQFLGRQLPAITYSQSSPMPRP